MTKQTSAARAVADVQEGVILARVEIAVPPERVFAALTTCELTKWWGADGLYRTTGFTIDLRPGGAWRTDGVGADGEPFYIGGEVLEVEAPHRLVQTWKASWSEGPATRVSYTIEALPTGSRVTVRHSGFTSRNDCDGHTAGWERVLGWLGGYLQPKAQPRYFMCRLVPPRPTFMVDMSADERAAMQRHVEYWTSRVADGIAVAFGPVADPAGGWGLGILAAPDEGAVRTFQEEDPAIKANIGLRYETLPMASLVY